MDFGSEIVDALLWDILTSIPEVTAVAGSSVHGLTYVPQKATMPAVLYYPEWSQVDGPVTTDGDVTGEQLRYVVRVMDEGTSTSRIRPAARAIRAALGSLVTDAPGGEQVTFTYNTNFVPTSSIQGSQGYRHLGCVYNVTVTSGG